MPETVRMLPIGRHVVLIQLDSPPVNAMSAESCAALLDIFVTLEKQTDVRAVVLTGSGSTFCSGADLKQVHRCDELDVLTLFGLLLDRISTSRLPLVAAVNGHCIGGGLELALCCDLRIAAEEAKFTCAGVNVGLIASTYRLPRLVGASRAKAMLLTGLPLDAKTAETWGLLTAVCRQDALRDASLELALRIASRAPLAVEAAKRCADRAINLTPDEARDLQTRETKALLASRDHKEALSAFLEKREPIFSRT